MSLNKRRAAGSGAGSAGRAQVSGASDASLVPDEDAPPVFLKKREIYVRVFWRWFIFKEEGATDDEGWSYSDAFHRPQENNSTSRSTSVEDDDKIKTKKLWKPISESWLVELYVALFK